MVSIPDWARFNRFHQPTKRPASVQSKYFRLREEETIKQVEEQGYFLDIDRHFIEEHFFGVVHSDKPKLQLDGITEEKKTDYRKIKFMKLVAVHVRTLSDIGLCNRLRICILHNNYIKDFQALANCVHLIKLDLHSNQISNLPGPLFWSGMRSLQLLLLHDNPIGKMENIHHLAPCSQLIGLTLYDTPVSLKKNYRHHVVNTIWSLKALDKHVISDEEIIEDAAFGGHFSALHPSFLINLSPHNLEGAGFEEEKALVAKVVAHINKVAAHHSPVLIIQKFVRGFLIRHKFKAVQDTRIWAAVTIQRGYRGWKGGDEPKEPAPPPPTSPAVAVPQEGADKVGMDYDTYLRNRRPGSTTASEISTVSRISRQQQSDIKSKASSQPLEVPDAPANSADITNSGERRRKNIFINLSKLHTSTLASLHDEAVAIETVFPSENTFPAESSHGKQRRHRKKRESKRKQIRSVKQFFGPVVDSVFDANLPSDTVEGDEVPVTQFRLQGLKKHIQILDPVAEMILSNRETGKKIREAENEHHQKVASARNQKQVKWKQTKSNHENFSHVQGTMGLSCLNAVQQAYKDRAKAEKHAGKIEYVLTIKEHRDAARERIRLFKEEKRNMALRERENDQKKMLDMLERQEITRINVVEKSRDHRDKTMSHQRQRRAELTFVNDFSAQNTSVSNALLRHDRHARQEDRLQEKLDVVKAQADFEKDQKEIVQKYLEHRKLMRQTENAMNKAALDSKMLQEANDRLMVAKAHVAQQKARNVSVTTFYPLPNGSGVTLPPVVESKSATSLEQWKTSVTAAPAHISQMGPALTT